MWLVVKGRQRLFGAHAVGPRIGAHSLMDLVTGYDVPSSLGVETILQEVLPCSDTAKKVLRWMLNF